MENEIRLVDQLEDRNGNLVDRSEYRATRLASGKIAVTELDRKGIPTSRSFELSASLAFESDAIALAMLNCYSRTMIKSKM